MYDGLDIQSIGVLGDDRVTIGKHLSRSSCHVPNVMEIDQVATRNMIILGMVLVPQQDGSHVGTYPGTIRVSVDRGFKGEGTEPGVWECDIANSMTDDSFKIYLEMASHGTIHNEPVIDFICKYDDDDFWDKYAKNRYKLFGEMAVEKKSTEGQTVGSDVDSTRQSTSMDSSKGSAKIHVYRTRAGRGSISSVSVRSGIYDRGRKS
jgi:hypothetical protein